MLLLKLTIVPLFIALVTLAGKKWGAQLAGLLGGLPIVAGPIVIFLALEHGSQFGVMAATAAISAVAGLLFFGIVYAWACLYWRWPLALLSAVTAWIMAANVIVNLQNHQANQAEISLLIALAALLLAPWLLPKYQGPSPAASSLRDLPLRMLAGAALTILVTQMAQALGGQWSGMLAAFPVIGSVLAVFIHDSQGATQVAQLYRGMVRGLYSFSFFFLVLVYSWTKWNFWIAVLLATLTALLVQVLIQVVTMIKNRKLITV